MSQSDLDEFKRLLKSMGFKVVSIDPAPGADYRISFKNTYGYTGSITYITLEEGFMIVNYTTNSDKFEELFVDYFAIPVKPKDIIVQPVYTSTAVKSDLSNDINVLKQEVDYHLIELNDLLKSRAIDDESILVTKNILAELSTKISVLEGVNK